MKKGETVDPLLSRLDTLIRLQATSMIGGLGSQKEKISFLLKAGLSTSSIADVLGISATQASKAVYKAKQSDKQKASSELEEP